MSIELKEIEIRNRDMGAGGDAETNQNNTNNNSSPPRSPTSDPGSDASSQSSTAPGGGEGPQDPIEI